MSNFFQLIAENKSVHPVIPIEGFIIIVWLIAVVVFGCVRRSKIPKINPDEILHEEKWRSGRSNRSILTRFGGARNCLDIKFLKDKIVIRPHFPFDLFRAEILGLVHEIPYNKVLSCETSKYFFIREIVLSFMTNKGPEKIMFTARQVDKVMDLCRRRG